MKENIFLLKELKAQRDKLLKNPELIEEFTFDIEKEFPYIKVKADIKTAKEWAEEYLNSEEGKQEIERINKNICSLESERVAVTGTGTFFVMLFSSVICLFQRVCDRQPVVCCSLPAHAVQGQVWSQAQGRKYRYHSYRLLFPGVLLQ